MKMVPALIFLLSMASFSALAGENYAAKNLKTGAILEITNDIHFGEKTFIVFLQEGKVLNEVVAHTLVGFSAENSHCSISVMGLEGANPNTGDTHPLKKGDIYQVDKVSEDLFSKGRVNIYLSSGAGRRLDMLCNNSVLLHSTSIKMDNIKKTLGNLVEIKD